MKLELQLNYRKILLKHQLNTSWREALKPRIYGINHITSRLVESAEAKEGWLGSHGQQLK